MSEKSRQNQIDKMLGAHVETKPNDFETALGLLAMEWITLIGLEKVLQGMDHLTHALEHRRENEG